MKKIILSLLSIAILSIQAYSQESFDSKKLDNYLQTLNDKHKMMATVAIAKDGKLVFNKSYGFYKKEGEKTLQATPTTKYRIGSMTKTFTAVLILQLIKEHKLKFDTKLSEFFPKIPNAYEITIEQMLSHRSGIYNITNDPKYKTYNTEPKTKDEMLKLIEGYKSEFDPGTKFSYSNTNFILLGYIIETLTQKPYAEVLNERIAKKANLENTYFGSDPDPKKNEASSYSYLNGEWREEPNTDMSIPHGAGAIVSTPEDLVKFLRALFNKEFFGQGLLDTMTTMQDGYGLGLFQIPFGDKMGYGHNGGIDGFQSSMVYFPGDDVTLVFTSNGLNYTMNDILIGILSIYYDKPFEMPEFKESITLTPEEMAKYEGDYGSADIPLMITIKIKEGYLTAQATGQSDFPLDAVSKTEFKFDPAGVVLKFDEPVDGEYKKFTLLQHGQQFEFER